MEPLTFAIVIGLILLLFWYMGKGQVKCPRCGAWMVWNDNGYNKYECRGCGHTKR